MLAAVAIYPSGTMREYAAVEVFNFLHATGQIIELLGEPICRQGQSIHPILMLENLVETPSSDVRREMQVLLVSNAAGREIGSCRLGSQHSLVTC